MNIAVIVLAGGTMLALAVAAAYVLGWANRKFAVEVDPRVMAVNGVLPGANCGGCGLVGCNDYAEAVVAGHATADKCTVGGANVAKAIAAILGLDLKASWPFRPVVHCGATSAQRLGQHPYRGAATCATANLVAGVQACTYGCLGLGDCVQACRFDAIHVADGLATVDYARCVGCRACAQACPRNIISMVPFKSERMMAVTCSNKDFGKEVKEVCQVGCIGCRACERNAKGLFTVHNNLPHINYDAYEPAAMEAINIAVDKCPMKRLLYVGHPTPKDLEETKDEQAPTLVQADFKTTVDQTDWQG